MKNAKLNQPQKNDSSEPKPVLSKSSFSKNKHAFSKGRQPSESGLIAITTLLKNYSLKRDELIEYLHLIQDRYHYLSVDHIAALAQLMRLSQTEIYETASFYAHFDIISADQTPPPPLTIRVCDSLTCAMMGAEILLEALSSDSDDIRIVRAPCMGRCDQAPVAEVGHHHICHASPERVRQAVTAGEIYPAPFESESLAVYEAGGGYQLLRACLAGKRDRVTLIEIMEQSGLRGLGGAGFPSGRKWRFVRQEAGPRLMAINADEGEPGTFKDRHYLETKPHQFLEGALIAAWIVEAAECYIYLRDEYPGIHALIRDEIKQLEVAGLTKETKLILRRGAGAYICGEESAMLESLEGKRGLPRHKPPFPSQVGLFGRPTLIHNVETVYWVPWILTHGAEAFTEHGANERSGFRSFSVSGRVKEPGVKVAPAGITIKTLIDDYCAGMVEGHQFKAYLPGGASGGILPASMADIPLDFDTLQPYGCFIGSAAIIVLSDQDNLRDTALNLMRFFEDESCGQCTPCRIGTEKAVKLMEQSDWDEALLKELADVMAEASICGLGQAAANPLLSVLKHFRNDLLFAVSTQK